MNKVTGTVPLAPKQGRYIPDRDVEQINKEKEVCLTCTRPTCKSCDTKTIKKKLKEKEKHNVH